MFMMVFPEAARPAIADRQGSVAGVNRYCGQGLTIGQAGPGGDARYGPVSHLSMLRWSNTAVVNAAALWLVTGSPANGVLRYSPCRPALPALPRASHRSSAQYAGASSRTHRSQQ